MRRRPSTDNQNPSMEYIGGPIEVRCRADGVFGQETHRALERRTPADRVLTFRGRIHSGLPRPAGPKTVSRVLNPHIAMHSRGCDNGIVHRPVPSWEGKGYMIRILSISSLTVVLLLASCLVRKAPPASETQTSTSTKVAELNKPMRPLATLNSNVWNSFPQEATMTPTSESDKAFADLDRIAASKDQGKLGDAQPDSIPPTFTLAVNANCRKGPDKRYTVMTAELAGKSFPIEGKSEDGNWFFVHLMENERCWFGSTVGNASGDLSQLRIYYGPPLSTDTPPLVCSTYKDKASCNANPACSWAPTTAGPGYCKTK